MHFSDWIHDVVARDFETGTLPIFLLRTLTDDVFLESQELINQGYRLITQQFGPNQGQKAWWRKGSPVIPVNRPPQPQGPIAAPQAPPSFFLATVVGNHPGLALRQKVAVAKRPDGKWDAVSPGGKTVVVEPGEVATVLQSTRGADGKPVKANSAEELLKPYAMPAATAEPKAKTIRPDQISEEQAAIDAKFEHLLNHPEQEHMMISALAGTGKTTMLKHLAWKYGKPGQKWLYVVFNTKNRVEAKEAFPPFVQVETSNGFLGRVIGSKENHGRIHQTDRIVNLNQGGDDDHPLEKARLLTDGPGFTDILARSGLNNPVDPGTYGKMAKTLTSLLKSIRYQFKEQVLTLAGLAKSFALDPRDEGSLSQGIKKILSSYDFDLTISDVKERINKYSGSYSRQVADALESILGYDFMRKSYADEIVGATRWLLEQSMPHGTEQALRHRNTTHNLGNLRDFNDDLWYAAVHADAIHWPHYDVVLADEVQDFNEDQKIMLHKLHEAGARIVAVGDRNQSIYRFRGADSDAFGNLSRMLGDLSGGKNVEQTLSKNFRSRKAIIDNANASTHVTDLKQGKVFADGDEGSVTRGLKYDEVFDALRQEKSRDGTIKETAFLARTNEPLVHAALKLLAQGTPFLIVGKDIAKDLRKHLMKITGRFGVRDDDHASTLAQRLQEFHDGEQESSYGQSAKKVYLQELTETTDALTAAVDQFQHGNPEGNVAQFKRWIGERLGGLDVAENERDLRAYKERMEREHPVILTTAHRSKGLEFSRVFLLRDDLFPHPRATRPEDQAQEANAKYVAYTRAKDEFHVLDLKGQPGYKEPQGEHEMGY